MLGWLGWAGGCNGYSFTLNYTESVPKGDDVVSEGGVTVFIEPKALFHTVGTRMDFQVRAWVGVGGAPPWGHSVRRRWWVLER